MGASPQFVDFDQDGDLDILCGSYSYTKALSGIYFIENDRGKWKQARVLKDRSNKVLNPGPGGRNRRREKKITPSAFDTDGDGDMDLLCISMDGEVTHFENIGTAREPKFSNRKRHILKCKGGEVVLPSNCGDSICFVDWDNDGKQDLIASSYAETLWYRNTADKGLKLDKPKKLLGKCGVKGVTSWDVNGDGKADLIAGWHGGMSVVYLRK